MRTSTAKRILAGMLVTLTAQTTSLKAAEYFLRTGTATVTLPNGSNVVMWGFAKDSAFGAMDGTVTVPGPALTVLPNDTTLTIHLDNNLPEPVSIVIPGQTIVPSPVRMGSGRARSFTTETAPSNGVPVNYVWSNLRPGTFLYQSGTHPSVQVQMGLYGSVRKDYAFSQTYPGVSFNAEVTLLYSEIDPVLHAAVATSNYGPGKAMTSTVGYLPKYFLINGHSYTNGMAPVAAGRPGDTVMIHFLNAGLETHVPIVNNSYLRLIAEDGFPYPYPKNQYSVFLPAGKTIDAVFTSNQTNTFALYDRRLDLINDMQTSGGMMTALSIMNPQAITNLPASWVTNYFGPGPYPPNTIGLADDPDKDGVSNLSEYIAGTDPTDPFSFLYISSINPLNPPQGPIVKFQTTASGRRYNMQYSTNLVSGPWTMVYTNIPGYAGYMYLTDLIHTNNLEGFYRVTVELP